MDIASLPSQNFRLLCPGLIDDFSKLASMPMDMAESPTEFSVTCELPGFNKNEIEVSILGTNLCIKAFHSESKTLDPSFNIHRERRLKRHFERTIQLPGNVDSSKICANLNNGILDNKILDDILLLDCIQEPSSLKVANICHQAIYAC
jgi:HSP20 family molecular chaperone IbpA